MTAATCPVAFTPTDPDPCPCCTCDREDSHTGHHHCPDCDVWYTLASDVTRAQRAGNLAAADPDEKG